MLNATSIISASPDVMGGTPVFAGTRVPVETFLDYLKAGESIDDFLDGFPTVTREQVIAFLEEAGNPGWLTKLIAWVGCSGAEPSNFKSFVGSTLFYSTYGTLDTRQLISLLASRVDT
jgi:uncharacterized protein (DUF433 family)